MQGAVRNIIAVVVYLAASDVVWGLKIPPADMTTWVFETPAALQQYASPVFGTLDDEVYTSRIVTMPSVTYPVTYIMGDIHERYVREVLAALFPQHQFGGAGSAPAAATATLRLLAVHNVHTVGKGFATRDITDDISAAWGLFDLQGAELYRFQFSGTATSNSGAGKNYGPRGRERTGLAYQDLLNNTVSGLAAAPQLQRFSQIPDLYLYPMERVARAEHRLLQPALDDPVPVLAAMRWLAVERGDLELYQVVRREFERRGLDSLRDESALLHAAIRSENAALFSPVLASSRALDTVEDGRTPLHAVLLREEHARAVALVGAGARPEVNVPDNVYLAAELNLKLAELLAGTPEAARTAYTAARHGYSAAITEAQEAIRSNEAEIWAARWARILAPIVQSALASAEAGAQARAMADQTGFIGFGTAVYRPAEFDTSTPTGAIAYLNDLIRHCNDQLARIPD